ncbi:MAG: RNA polymerase sigma-70 factor [Prolixibacteraceae bacterium]|nr:RNA polymerase sigma-70 factor [Prolixibacteraceae bacterium]
MKTSELNKLLKQIKVNDKDAINSIFLAYSKRLYNFAFAYLKTEGDSKDVVQDAFINLWNNRENLREDTNLEAYLFTITRNSVISIFRKKITEKEYLKHLRETAIFQYSENDEQYDYERLSMRIKNLVDQLPEQRKLIFKLSKEKGLSNKAIAEELNISVKTVEDHMTKARRFLKSQLTDYGIIALLFFDLFF